MSVKSKSSTTSQAAESKISETTKREDKGQNRVVIDWFTQRDRDSPFLHAGETTVTYGEMAEAVQRRVSDSVRFLRPEPTVGSVLDVLAGIAGGGAIVAGHDAEIPENAGMQGASLVVFTSGSSGPPKGARLTMSNLESAARSSVEHLGHGADDTWLLAMPLTHVGGLSILVRSAYAGGAVRMLDGFDPVAVAESLAEDVTMVSVVPTMLRRLLSTQPGPYSGLRAVLVGGGPIPDGLLEQAQGAGLPVLPTYGMTETFGQVATLRPGEELRRHAKPLPGVDLRIVPDGRIAVRGPQVSPGYLGEPDRESDWLVTNDLGEIDDEGAVRVLGRADTMIVTGGENVDPQRVETELMQCPGVLEVVVIGIPDEEWGTAVACVFSGTADPDAVTAWARSRLPGHAVPKTCRRVAAIPRTALGKPDRSAAAGLLSS